MKFSHMTQFTIPKTIIPITKQVIKISNIL